jgi:ABC-type multidrug transport system ATPase subunit
MDVHVSMHTVREAVDFSAQLRLASSVSAEVRSTFVEEILQDLELLDIADRLIGDVDGDGDCLSSGELKRVTIGVELAANPTFLFLDEPTSGLDSRAARIVLRVLANIAKRGRAVVCTIHQPSAELFDHFDSLLLLKSGGKVVYFGPVSGATTTAAAASSQGSTLAAIVARSVR